MKKSLILFALLSTFILSAQDKETDKETDKEKDKDKSKKIKTISELTKSSIKMDGLFIIYQDTVSGELKMEIRNDQLNQDYIYFSQIADGVTEAGSFRGAYGSDVVFHIKKYFNKIEIVAPNTNFYFDPNNPLSRSQEANMSHAVISSNKILSEDLYSPIFNINYTINLILNII